MHRRTFVIGAAGALGAAATGAALAAKGMPPAGKFVIAGEGGPATLRLYAPEGASGPILGMIRLRGEDAWFQIDLDGQARRVLADAARAGAFRVAGRRTTLAVELSERGTAVEYRYRSDNGSGGGRGSYDPSSEFLGNLIKAIGSAVGGLIRDIGKTLAFWGQAITIMVKGDYTMTIESNDGQSSAQINVKKLGSFGPEGFMADPGCDTNPLVLC